MISDSISAILKNQYDVITLPPIISITMTFGKQMQSDVSIIIHRSKWKPELEFCYGATKSVYTYTSRGFRYLIEICFAQSAIIVPESCDSTAAAVLKITITNSLW